MFYLWTVLQPHRERTSVQDCLKWAVKCMKAMQSRVPIVIETSTTEYCDFVLTDKLWLMENILCYLSNAVKYSLSGAVSVHVDLIYNEDVKASREISERPEHSDTTSMVSGETPQLRITVEDHGIGIPDGKKAELFKPFQQTMRHAGGTGLGLYSLSLRMEALGGQYGVSDRKDGKQGTQFWFSIPYQPDTSSSKPVHANLLAVSNRISRNNSDTPVFATNASHTSDTYFDELNERPSVLVVEDSVVITKATRRMLIKAGFAVDTADNGALGLEKMKEKVYEFVLMDLQMPIMDGLEATKRIRAHEKETGAVETDRQYIIGVSANGTDDVRGDAMKSGMCDFCSKPFSYQDLCDVQLRRIGNVA